MMITHTHHTCTRNSYVAIMITHIHARLVGYNGFPTGCDDNELPWTRTADDPMDTKYMYSHTRARAHIRTYAHTHARKHLRALNTHIAYTT